MEKKDTLARKGFKYISVLCRCLALFFVCVSIQPLR